MEKDIQAIMVLPRRTLPAPIHKKVLIPETDNRFIFEQPEEKPVIFELKTVEIAGMQRQEMTISASASQLEEAVLKNLIAQMAAKHDAVPGKYPLYVNAALLPIQVTALLARLGFMPYFGSWQTQSEAQSAAIWDEITQKLRDEL